MFNRLITKAVVIGGVMAGAAGLNALDAHNLEANYTLVDAKIVSVAKDCFVKAGREKLVHKDTNKLAYIPCEIAPAIAVEKGFSKQDVTEHAVVTYSYRSPVDKKTYRRPIREHSNAPAISRRSRAVASFRCTPTRQTLASPGLQKETRSRPRPEPDPFLTTYP